MRKIVLLLLYLPLILISEKYASGNTPYQKDSIWIKNLKVEPNISIQLDEIVKRIYQDTSKVKAHRISFTDSSIQYFVCDTVITKKLNTPKVSPLTIPDFKSICGDKIFVMLKYKKNRFTIDLTWNPWQAEYLSKLTAHNIYKIDFLSFDETIDNFGVYTSIYGSIILYTENRKLYRECSLTSYIGNGRY